MVGLHGVCLSAELGKAADTCRDTIEGDQTRRCGSVFFESLLGLALGSVFEEELQDVP